MLPRGDSPFSDRSSFFFRLRKFLPRFSSRRREHLSTKVFAPSHRAYRAIDFTPRQKITAAVIVTIGGLIIGLLFVSGIFDIKKVSVLRSSLDLPLAEINLLTRQQAFGKNILLLDTAALAKTVQAMRPDIARVTLTKQPPATLIVEIVKYPIVARIVVGSDNVYVNENGYRVDGQTPDRDTFTLAIDGTFDVQNRKLQLVKPAHLTTMRDAKAYFEGLTNMPVSAVKYLPAAHEAHLILANKTTIWLDLTSDYRTQLDKLTLAAETLTLGKKAFDHIDLRIRNKIFYKPFNARV